jgi:RNA polymerase sigma factor (sigma-70 family)
MGEDPQHIISLTKRMQGGDMDCFEEFYELTKKFIYFSIVKIVDDFSIGEDLLQDTYVYFLNNIQKIDASQSPIGYLLITGKHLSIDYLRKRNREVNIDEVACAFYEDEEHPSELLSAVKKILKPDEAEIVLLHVSEDLTFQEIATYLTKPLGTVQWKYNEAMKKLRKEIKEDAY